MSSYSPLSSQRSHADQTQVLRSGWILAHPQQWLLFGAASFLVSVPVFFQAPLVRIWPMLSLVLTAGWFCLSVGLLQHKSTQVWGDLLLGFTWTWLAGSLYWGWLRWEPYWHLPVEAIALPMVLFFLYQGRLKIGSWFYLGSLLGTCITDIYFYWVDLIPQWRQLMQVDFALAMPIFQAALTKMQTSWGMNCALVLSAMLVVFSVAGLRTKHLYHWGFSGAVFSTLLVDGLFWLTAQGFGF